MMTAGEREQMLVLFQDQAVFVRELGNLTQ